jgi:putative peptidoglycan lipid II flippase
MLISPNDASTKQEGSLSPLLAVAFSVRAQPFWILWLFGYAYAFVIAIVLQKLVMPIMPGLHAGYGLMNHDAIIFHDMAAVMADRIHAAGWSEWRLIPGHGITANVGILAAIYAVFGVDPVWFIPLNAGFHALGALLVLRLGLFLLPGRGGWIAGSTAALLFLVFPSALVWYGQNHKDAFLIAGYLMMLFAFISSLARQTLPQMLSDLVLMSAGCTLVAIMRPHMLVVYAAAFAIALMVVAFWQFIKPARISSPAIRNGVLMLGLIVAVITLAPRGSELVTVNFSHASEAKLMSWRWEKTDILPDAIERKLEQVSFVRAHFIESGRLVGAGSAIDDDVSPMNAWQMAAYLPRALWVGLFAPFPDTWLEHPTLPRLIGAVETLIFYLMASGILVLVLRQLTLPLFVCLAVSGVVLTVLGYTSPNVGTLHRIRYGPLFVFMLAGLGGWTWLFGKVGRLLRNVQHGSHAVNARTSAGGQVRGHILGSKISGGLAVGAGALVTLVSVVSALGLLIRDLLLVNLSDFGASLDSFYLAMMLPMLFVSALTLPFGDALTAAMHRMEERHSVQSLLGTTITLSLLILGLLSLVLFMAAGPIYGNFVIGGEFAQILTLIPLTLLLLFFSGLVVIGNSLLNSLGKPVMAAAAQLIVPLAAVAAILIASEGSLILMATAGMVVGQILNLVILHVLARGQGFYLLPSSIRKIDEEGRMLTNYGWLVAAALFVSLSIPLNYWLAGQVGTGSVSTWAVGSKLVQMAMSLVAAMISAVWVPYFSKLLAVRLHLRIRDEVYLSLMAGSWGAGLVALMLFGFAGPMVTVAIPAVQDEIRVAQLMGVIQIGALQLPPLVSGIIMLKFSAVSEVYWKGGAAALFGLLANAVLGYLWLPVWGIFGIAAAWYIATLLTTTFIMFATRRQSFLGCAELISIVASWFVLGVFALAIHLKSLSVTAGAVFLLVLVFFIQAKNLISWRSAPEIVTG